MVNTIEVFVSYLLTSLARVDKPYPSLDRRKIKLAPFTISTNLLIKPTKELKMKTYSEEVTIEIEGKEVECTVDFEHEPAEYATRDCPGTDELLNITRLEICDISLSSDDKPRDISWMLMIGEVNKSVEAQLKEI